MATDPPEEVTLLQFAPFVSRIDTGFWHKLGINKLDVFKLDEDAKRIHGYYRNGKANSHLKFVSTYTLIKELLFKSYIFGSNLLSSF